MIKKHTSQSLARYIGMLVIRPSYDQAPHKLRGITSDRTCWLSLSGHPRVSIEEVYPILKDYTQLIVPMEFNGETFYPLSIYTDRYKIESLENTGGLQEGFTWDDEELWMTVEGIRERPLVNSKFCRYIADPGYWKVIGYLAIEMLVQLSFGAIAHPESPTGYVDLFGYPCALFDPKVHH